MYTLITKHLTFDTSSLEFESVKYFAETGQITGSLLIRLRNMLIEAQLSKKFKEPYKTISIVHEY